MCTVLKINKLIKRKKNENERRREGDEERRRGGEERRTGHIKLDAKNTNQTV